MKITKDIKFKFQEYKVGKPICIFGMFDDQMKSAFNITDEEYDYLCEHMTDEETGVMVTENPTFAERRQMIEIRNRYLEAFSKSLG